MPDPADLDQQIRHLETQIKDIDLRDKKSSNQLLNQSFLVALPIILTVSLGFIANYYQSQNQHKEQLTVLREQGVLERQKQERLAKDTRQARLAEAGRAFTLQDRDAKAQLARQEREFAANSLAARSQFAQEQNTLRIQHSAQQAQQAREFQQDSERQRRQSEVEIIIKASEVPTSLSPEQQDVQRARNLLWFADAGYVRVSDEMHDKLLEVGEIARGQSIPIPVVQSEGRTAAVLEVRNFQAQRGMPADGILGPITCAALFEQEKISPGTANQQLLKDCRARFQKQ